MQGKAIKRKKTRDFQGTFPVHQRECRTPWLSQTHWRQFSLLSCALLLVLLSGCTSLLSGVSGFNTPTPSTVATLAPTATMTPLPLNTESEIAQALLQKMSLDQKLGQMVISEFTGSTVNGDLSEMIKTSQISGVLIENKNGNAQTRNQLVSLNKAMQGQATFPLFITTDFEGGLVNELRQILGERASEAAIGSTGNPQVAYNAGKKAASDLISLGLNVNFM